jgi:hypothetical protein
MRRLVSFLFLGSTAAWAAPAQLGHQGRLLDEAGVPVEGEVSLLFRLYDDAAAGAVVWEEAHDVSAANGFYSVVLGADEAGNPLDVSLVAENALFLELVVDGGDPLSPRHGLNSVPYAMVATQAESVKGGVVDASEVRVNGSVVVDADGAWTGTALAWSDLSGMPADFGDGTDADSLVDFSCLDGEFLVWDSVLLDWACTSIPDTDTQLNESEVDNYVSNNGYALASDLSALALSGSWADLTGAPVGLADGDDDTQLTESEVDGYVSNNGYLLSSNVAAIATSGDWSDLSGLPSGLADGDDDNQLTESEVETFITNGVLDFASGTTIGGGECLLADTSGNVGIGTTTPAKTLEVKAGSSGNGINLIAHDNTTAVIQLESGSAGGYVQLHDSSNDQKVRLDSTGDSWFNGGNVGIGTTSPTAALDVDGNIFVSNAGTIGRDNGTTRGANIQFADVSPQGNSATIFRDGGTDLMLVDGGGNVGIGTTSPTATLDVAGEIAYQADGSAAKVHNWGGEGSFVLGTSTMSSSWTKTQSIDVPSAGTYLVMSNFRIRRQNSGQSFVKAELRWNDGNAQSTEDRMVCENVGYQPGFNNYGGTVSWVVTVDAATTIEGWYYSQASNDAWYNDGNGVPRIVATRLY